MLTPVPFFLKKDHRKADVKLEYRTISKSFAGEKALANVSFSLEEGICAFLGPNGAGKSTLLGITTGLIRPDYGEILLDQINIHHPDSSFFDRIGYVPQPETGYADFSALDFLQYMAMLKGTTRKTARAESLRALASVDLENECHKTIREMSGGMRQRLRIAQAFIGGSDIIILDEPTSGLDPEQRLNIRNLIAELSFGKLILFATHVVADIEMIADTILIINKGRIVLHKRREDLLQYMEHRVCELPIGNQNIKDLRRSYLISEISRDAFASFARIILMPGQEKPADAEWRRPTTQDAYLLTLHSEWM